MSDFLFLPRRVTLWCGGALGGGAFAGITLAAALAAASATVAAPASCAALLPYPEAVARTDKAARAVLAPAGRESCVVVTPMSLAFMDDTSRELLRLIGGAPAPAGVSGARPEPEPMPGDGPTP